MTAWCVALAIAVQTLSIQPRNPEGNLIVPGVAGDIVYRRVGGRELALDAYVQKRGERRPAVVVIHGGGWTSGSRIAYVGQILELLTSGGYNWFSIDYRLGPIGQFRDAVEDVRAAVEFVRAHAEAFRIDPDRIVLLGEDAGAQLAALVASGRPAGVQGAVLLGGFYDLNDVPRLSGAATVEILTQASPIQHLRARMPPLLVIHGGEDRDVRPEQAERFCRAARSSGSRCDLLVVPGAIHAVENWRPAEWKYKERLLEWLGGVAGLRRPAHEPYRARLAKNLVFARRGTSDAWADLLLDAYVPEGAGPFPAAIIAHGGGWEAGDKVTYITPILEPLARAGLAWFSIDYRLTPTHRHAEQLDDLRRAVRWVRYNARKYRIDPGRIALIGESASGQMVAQLACEPGSRNPASPDPIEREGSHVAAAVSFYGVYDFDPIVTDASPRSLLARLFGLHTLDDAARAVLRRYSPHHNARRDMPPILLIHGTNERLWQQGVRFAERLKAIGARHELYPVEGAPHGMENWEGHPEWQGYKQKLIDWLRVIR